jgi:transcriptional regulator with XRE-family HTH domain
MTECPEPIPPQAPRNILRDLVPKGRKDRFLPEIAQLALEGYTNRAISRKTGVPRRTVDRWLQEQRQEWIAKASESSADVFSVTVARLESAYREAMDAWRRSLADKQVRLEEVAPAAGDQGEAKTKTSIRTESQSGQAALLGKAVQAAMAICEFKGKHLDAQRELRYQDPQRDVIDLAENLENLSNEELDNLKALLQAANAPARMLIEEEVLARDDRSDHDAA